MGIGMRIKQRRESLGMTQEELALKLGYKSRSTIAKIEKETRDVSQSKLFGFASVLRTSPEYLLGYASAEENNISQCNFVDMLFKDGTTATIISNNERFLKSVRIWTKEFTKEEFSDEELHSIIDYAKFLISKRK